MALKKEIELENGIILNYHRIVSINKITNTAIIIEVASYISQAKREEEAEAIRISQETGEAVEMNILINTIYLNKEYEENETIKDLYEYLKTTDKFKNAEDV
jgi:hypothetical protein